MYRINSKVFISAAANQLGSKPPRLALLALSHLRRLPVDNFSFVNQQHNHVHSRSQPQQIKRGNGSNKSDTKYNYNKQHNASSDNFKFPRKKVQGDTSKVRNSKTTKKYTQHNFDDDKERLNASIVNFEIFPVKEVNGYKGNQLIRNEVQFKDFCNNVVGGLNKDEIIALDTEFIIGDTYIPVLEVVQLNIRGESVAIDVPGVGKANLTKLMKNIKDNPILVHGCVHDMELLLHHTGMLPKNAIDTQIAYALCYPSFNQISLQNLVREVLDINLSKTQTLSDWSKRPLTKQQVEYALDDVVHLSQVWNVLEKKLKELGRLDMFHKHMKVLTDECTYNKCTEEAWLSIWELHKIERKYYPVVKALAKWREERAKVENVSPTYGIFGNKLLLSLASADIKAPCDLLGVYGLKKFVLTKLANDLVNLLTSVKPDEDTKLELPTSNIKLTNEQELMRQCMQTFVSSVALKNNMSSHILCSTEDILAMVCANTTDNNNGVERLDDLELDVLSDPVKKQLVGDDLVRFRSGETSFKFNKDNTTLGVNIVPENGNKVL